MGHIEWSDPMKGWPHFKFFDHIYPGLYGDLKDAKYTPAYSLWWKPFDLCKPDKVKVVIIGTEPYSDEDANNGLAFSCRAATKTLPPSLREVFRELQDDLGLKEPRNGDLSPWADRGTLLLNCSLTRPNDNRWSRLTYEVVRYLSDKRDGLVFFLWGEVAQELKAAIDASRHLVVCSSHPGHIERSASSVPFRGSKPFSTAARYNPELGVDYWRL